MSSTPTKKDRDRPVTRPATPAAPSALSDLKWWLISFLSIGVLAWILRGQLPTESSPSTEERLFTAEELRSYTTDELYLAVLGHVFNVSSAPRFYSSTGSYKYYTGRDASRSFHTGGTNAEDLTDDLTGLNDEEIAGVHHWLTFYQKQYSPIGKLIGRYFDSNGSPTEHYNNVLRAVETMNEKDEEKNTFAQQWPPCNSEWSHATGRRVWCTQKSGGVDRSWTGVPRRYFDSTTKSERCVCVQNANQVDGRFKQYENCLASSSECRLAD